MAYQMAALRQPGGTGAQGGAMVRRLLPAALALSLLGGCGWIAAEKGAPPPCPDVSILAEAAELVQFRPGAGRDLTDVQYQAEVAGLGQTCRYRGDTLESTVNVTLVASRGAAYEGGPVNLRYFVAVVDRASEQILARQEFDSPVEFPQGRNRAGAVEEVVQRIELPSGRLGDRYEVLVGLQLTEDQVAYNRQRRGY